jgi:hypothetical protein
MSKYKSYFALVFLLAIMILGHYLDPIATYVFAAVFALILVGLGLQIYFMPLKRKYENVAKYKARHGIPIDQPHKADDILKRGFFRIRS